MNVANAALTVPDNVRSATIQPPRVESSMLGQGLWLIAGGSHNSVLIEFRDYVAVIEAPLNEARSLAVIAEVNRLVPNKPIRYLVNTHHHWDHLGGIRTYVHEGATVVTHENNKPYYQEVLRAGTWNARTRPLRALSAGRVVGRLHLRNRASRNTSWATTRGRSSSTPSRGFRTCKAC